jgi:uncharacterized protein YkwD
MSNNNSNSKSNTNTNTKYKNLIEDLFTLHNEIREDPKSFIPNLKKELKNFKENIREKQVGEEILVIETSEGKKAVQEAIDYLQKLKPVQKLKLKDELSQVANDHAFDLSKNGLYDSEGSDGSLPDQRINKYFDTSIHIGEIVELNFITAEDIVFSLIVDDGMEDRSRRYNFFNPKFNFIGIGISDHPDYENCCVMDYIGEIFAIKPIKKGIFYILFIYFLFIFYIEFFNTFIYNIYIM